MRKAAAQPATASPEGTTTDRAFGVVWEMHADELRRRCRRWMGNPDLGEEAFSRGAMRAFEKYVESAATILDPRSWLFTVVHNECMNIHRERRFNRFDLLDDVDPMRLATRGNPEKDMIRGELAVLLRRAVAELPPRLRVPLELVVYEERSYREVARLLDVTEPSLRKRMQQARARVRARLRAYDRGRPPRAMHGVATRDVERTSRFLVVQPVTRRDGTKVEVERLADEPPAVGGEAELRRLQRHVDRHGTGWKIRARLARALLSAGETEAAIVQYRAALQRRPDRSVLAVELSAILRAWGNHEEADRLRDSAAPADAALLAAHDALRDGKISQAIAQLEPLAARGDAIAMLLLADALRASGIHPRLEIPPGTRVVVQSAATVEEHALALLARGDSAGAVAETRAYAASEPRYARAWLVFARVAAAANREHDALAAALRALVLDTTTPAVTLDVARVISWFDPQRAAAIAATAPRTWPTAIVECEIAARHCVDPDRARSLAANVTTLEPQLALSWIRAAQVLLAGGVMEEALAAFERGVALLRDLRVS